MHKLNIALLALLGCALNLSAQEKPKSKTTDKAPQTSTPATKKADTVPAAVKPYQEIITSKAKTSKGMFKVHQIGQRYFFEIPDTLLKRDILVVNRISKSATGPRPQMTGYAGDEIAQNVINFEKGPEDRIFMKLISFNERANDTTENGLYKSVLNSNLQPIVAVFPVKAYGGDSTKVKTNVIDVTDFINTENEILHFSSRIKSLLGVGALQNDKSFINSISAYPMNVEIRTLRTYSRGAIGGQPQITTLPVTYELNSSIVLLPKVPMKARFADSRVGFFGQAYVDFDAEPQNVKQSVMMVRWRLEPKDAEVEKYKRGELVEPKKPIVYYIDPATPKKWIPYLIAGVNDWQKAFEQAGFKNAIIAMPAPTDDPTWSIDDARHNVIVYKPSSVANASGPNVHDPRSGEIIETHINWYHNIMSLVRNWYLIQAGAVDPRARKMKFDDELMGQLIRFVSSHEVGHTLGLLHNFGSSSTVPVEKLRDKSWLEKNGHTPSIMDYARFNYVAQPEDGVTEKGLFPRIGDYDKWAIEFGYKWLPQFKDAASEGIYLNKWIIERTAKDKRLYFGNENEFSDPRSQSEDLGDDAMLASTYGIKNLKRIVPQLKDWTAEPSEGYGNLKMMYEEIFRQFQTYLGHVTRNVAGLYATPKSIEQKGPIFEYVAYDKQKEAMKFLKENVFYTPEWLIDQDIISKTGTSSFVWISVAQNQVLNRLQGSDILNKLLTAEMTKDQKSYTATEFLDDLKLGVWEEIYTNKPIDVYRRNLQKTYIANAAKAFVATGEVVMTSQGSGLLVYINPDPTRFDASSLTRANLLSLKEDIQKAIPSQQGLSKYHLEDMAQRITDLLSPKSK